MAHYPLLYFNSIKVQLKRGMEQAGYNTALFQFHKGTIKTRTGQNKKQHRQFQFHKGTIKTLDTKRETRLRTSISIP